MLQRLRTRAVERFWSSSFDQGLPFTWIAEPAVRLAANIRITGSHQWPLEWFAEKVVTKPFDDVVSVGCGEGELERDIRRKGISRKALGLDLSTAALDSARASADQEGFPEIRYERADFNALELPPEAFDAAFFQQSIHHVADLEGCLATVSRSLRPGGLLYLDEYVGPSRHEWNRELLAHADVALAELPADVVRHGRLRILIGQRRKRVPAPVDWRDPSEAIRSSEILRCVREYFDIVHQRDYGGNLLSLIHPYLRREALDEEGWTALLEGLIEAESELLSAGEASYYAVLVARRK